MYRTNLTFSIFSTDNSRWWSARQSSVPPAPPPTIAMDESRSLASPPRRTCSNLATKRSMGFTVVVCSAAPGTAAVSGVMPTFMDKTS